MEYQGFRSISEYESECARFGYATRRIPFHKGNEKYFALVTTPPKHPTSDSWVECWTLFTADETVEVLDGIISRGTAMHADPMVINGKLEPGYMQNGVDVNYLGKLAAHGYYPDNQEETAAPSRTFDTIFTDESGQLCLAV